MKGAFVELVYFETLASGDILVDVNGTPLVLDLDLPDGGGGIGGSAYWKDPVELASELPSVGNADGDLRLVRSELRI